MQELDSQKDQLMKALNSDNMDAFRSIMKKGYLELLSEEEKRSHERIREIREEGLEKMRSIINSIESYGSPKIKDYKECREHFAHLYDENWTMGKDEYYRSYFGEYLSWRKIFDIEIERLLVEGYFSALSESDLEEFPEIKEVEELYLEKKDLHFLPETISCFSSLKRIVLNFNKLSTLPKSISHLRSLDTLELSFNKFTTIPDFLRTMDELTILYLSGLQSADIEEILSKLPRNLSELILGKSNIFELPDSIGEFTSLQYLGFSENNLTSLPDSIANLKNLTKISLGDNQFSTFPEVLLKLPKLKHIVFIYNKFKKNPRIAHEIDESIVINLANNPFLFKNSKAAGNGSKNK